MFLYAMHSITTSSIICASSLGSVVCFLLAVLLILRRLCFTFLIRVTCVTCQRAQSKFVFCCCLRGAVLGGFGYDCNLLLSHTLPFRFHSCASRLWRSRMVLVPSSEVFVGEGCFRHFHADDTWPVHNFDETFC